MHLAYFHFSGDSCIWRKRAQLFQIFRSHIKILRPKRATWSQFHNERGP